MQKPQAGEYRVYQGRRTKQFKNQGVGRAKKVKGRAATDKAGEAPAGACE